MVRVIVSMMVALALIAVPMKTVDADDESVPAQVAQVHAFDTVRSILARRLDYLDVNVVSALTFTILRESKDAGFDPLFMLAVMNVESGFDIEAISPTGALGLMQIIPGTWKLVTEQEGLGRLQRFNPIHNATVGIRYFKYLAKSFKRPDSMLLAYNQGPGMASAILTKRAKPSDEAATFASKIWGSYKKILAEAGIETKDFKKLYRSPDLTVYRVEMVAGNP